MNIYDQEVSQVLATIAEKIEQRKLPEEQDIITLAQLIDYRTGLLIEMRDQLISSESAIQSLISELESADLTIEDMDDFINKLRNRIGSAR